MDVCLSQTCCLDFPRRATETSVWHYGDALLKNVYPSDYAQQYQLVNHVLEASVFSQSYEWFRASCEEGLRPSTSKLDNRVSHECLYCSLLHIPVEE